MTSRRLSLISMILFSVYMQSLLFEGPLFYALAERFAIEPGSFGVVAICAQFAGLFVCGFFVKGARRARLSMTFGMAICLLCAPAFLLSNPALWLAALVLGPFASGCIIASWGYFLKRDTPAGERIKTCADMLAGTYIMSYPVRFVTMYLSPFVGLALAALFLLIGLMFAARLPLTEADSPGIAAIEETAGRPIRTAMIILFAFVTIITINSGLMYRTLLPAFSHYEMLNTWYLDLPYIAAILLMRNLRMGKKRAPELYVAMGMMMLAFLLFIFTGRNTAGYFTVITPLLAACGVFDLFWWSMLGESLDYGKNPVQIFGIGMSSNLLGILLGGWIAGGIASLPLQEIYATVIALVVCCVTVAILPALNRSLVLLLKSYTYLTGFDLLDTPAQQHIIHMVQEPLTEREGQVLQQVLMGRTNRLIAEELHISENTVKSHLRNIYQKYDVGGRAELISTLLRGQLPK